MKKSTSQIIEKFPRFKDQIHAYENMLLANNALKDLNSVESTFLKLIWFFENPEQETFDLRTLYLHLENDWLEFALELIVQFYREDTYLIRKPSFCIIKESSDYLNLTQFAEFLSANGLNYNRQKLNLYFSRGIVPKPDLIIGNVKYWSKKTVEYYKKTEENRPKFKKGRKNEG